MSHCPSYEVIVVGGGHAGTEAALAAARMGCQTLLLTHNLETLGQMSCNPAIGGIGKSHLVREIDALGGAMALATDQAGIQFRVLNRRKGPAVRATRAQADRNLYKRAIRNLLECQENLHLFQQGVSDLSFKNGQVVGVITEMGVEFHAQQVVLTVGTFLGGVMHVGLEQRPGGRAGEQACALGQKLRQHGFNLRRLKTGTPPRIDGRSIDFSKLQIQEGDKPLPTMSFWGRTQHPRQLPCYITRTCEKSHAIIRQGLSQSPLYTGRIQGQGPRYCPSVEDKIQRFADKNSHQIFLEPEGLDSYEFYPNGLSTSLPFTTQLALVRSIEGLENAHITRPGYAIEYDFFDPRDLYHTLESRKVTGLFFAGQINGTTGYEEAGAQGLLAGVNAALKAQGKPSWYPYRDEAYLGVLMDDLVTQGTTEPYRMFTSRAEYRLLLREDNADQRLTPKGRELGLITDANWQIFCAKMRSVQRLQKFCRGYYVKPEAVALKPLKHKLEPLERSYSLEELLRRPQISFADIASFLPEDGVAPEVAEQIEIHAKYAGYVSRQEAEIARMRQNEALQLTPTLDYDAIEGLSQEIKEKLKRIRPRNLGQAARIAGVTPAAISILLIYLKKYKASPNRQITALSS